MILAIDDDPERYEHLIRLLDGRAQVVVACCPTCVAELLPLATAVLLDYDLDSGDPCPRCFASYALWSSHSKAIVHVGRVAERKIPVIVTSASRSENIHALCLKLKEHGVKPGQYRASDIEPELNWIGRLFVMGVL